MKKILSALLVIICLCSCSSGETKPKLTNLSFSAELTYYNETYLFDGRLLDDATLKATIKQPEELKDLNLTVTPEGITAEYLGLTYTANEATMPFSKTIWDFYLPINNIINNTEAVADKNGALNGEANGNKYILTVSPTGLPQKLEIANGRILVKFYNVEIKEE